MQGLGVGKGVFYWYFRSKEELFLEILRDAQRQLRRRQQPPSATSPTRCGASSSASARRWRGSREHRSLFNLFQFAATEERFAPAHARGQDVAVNDVVRHVKDGIVEGRIRDADPYVLSHATLGVAVHLARTFIHERNRRRATRSPMPRSPSASRDCWGDNPRFLS